MSQKKINRLSVSIIIIGLCGLMIDKYMQTKSMCWMNIYLEGGYQRVFTMIMATGIFLGIKNMDLTRCEKKLKNSWKKYIGNLLYALSNFVFIKSYCRQNKFGKVQFWCTACENNHCSFNMYVFNYYNKNNTRTEANSIRDK